MEILSIFLFIILLTKTVGIFNATRWLSIKGKDYKADLEEKRPDCDEDYFKLFEKNNGNFFPFGFKHYRLRRYIAQTSSKSCFNKLTIIAAKLFHSFLYRFERLTFVISVYILFMVPLCKIEKSPAFIPHYIHSFILIGMTILLIFANILLSIEAVYSYGVLKGYASSFHMLSKKHEQWAGGSQFILEIRVIVGRLLTTIISGTLAFYSSYIFNNSLQGVIVEFNGSSILNWATIFLQSAYFSLTTLLTVGYGDINPANGCGQFISFCVELQSFTLLGLVFTSLFSISREA